MKLIWLVWEWNLQNPKYRQLPSPESKLNFAIWFKIAEKGMWGKSSSYPLTATKTQKQKRHTAFRPTKKSQTGNFLGNIVVSDDYCQEFVGLSSSLLCLHVDLAISHASWKCWSIAHDKKMLHPLKPIICECVWIVLLQHCSAIHFRTERINFSNLAKQFHTSHIFRLRKLLYFAPSSNDNLQEDRHVAMAVNICDQ